MREAKGVAGRGVLVERREREPTCACECGARLSGLEAPTASGAKSGRAPPGRPPLAWDAVQIRLPRLRQLLQPLAEFQNVGLHSSCAPFQLVRRGLLKGAERRKGRGNVRPSSARRWVFAP